MLENACVAERLVAYRFGLSSMMLVMFSIGVGPSPFLALERTFCHDKYYLKRALKFTVTFRLNISVAWPRPLKR
jgi:hypothetical protein